MGGNHKWTHFMHVSGASLPSRRIVTWSVISRVQVAFINFMTSE